MPLPTHAIVVVAVGPGSWLDEHYYYSILRYGFLVSYVKTTRAGGLEAAFPTFQSPPKPLDSSLSP